MDLDQLAGLPKKHRNVEQMESPTMLGIPPKSFNQDTPTVSGSIPHVEFTQSPGKREKPRVPENIITPVRFDSHQAQMISEPASKGNRFEDYRKKFKEDRKKNPSKRLSPRFKS